MNHTKWAAWGVVDLEALDRQQRRNYLKKVRDELAARDLELHSGGSTKTPFYAINYAAKDKPSQCYAGVDAFKKICAWSLEQLGEAGERSEDGGLRGAGDTAA